MLSIAARCTTPRNSPTVPSSTRTMIPMAIPSIQGTGLPRSPDTSTTIFLVKNPSLTDSHRKSATIIRACSSIGLPVSTDTNQAPNWRKKESARTPADWRAKEKEINQKGAGLPAGNRWTTVKAGTESRASGFSEGWVSISSQTTNTSTLSNTNCHLTFDRLVFTIIIQSSAFISEFLYPLYCIFEL